MKKIRLQKYFEMEKKGDGVYVKVVDQTPATLLKLHLLIKPFGSSRSPVLQPQYHFALTTVLYTFIISTKIVGIRLNPGFSNPCSV